MSKTTPTLGSKLRDWRKLQDLSTKDAGAMIGVSGVQWHRYESGERGVPFDRLVAIAGVTGIALSKLRPDLAKQFSEPAQ